MRTPTLILCCLFLSLSFLSCGGKQSIPTSPVSVESGQVRGTFEEDGKVAVFKGIPFAAPPVGELRWQPPQPAKPWNGVRDATAYGSSCPQENFEETGGFFDKMIEGQGMGWFRKTLFKLLVGMTAGEPKENEDCLYLNVRTSNLGEADKQPVMVWIHGGGHQTGSGSDSFYQSNSLVLRGVILVTINYRLGPFGYFAHPELSAESENGVSGNYGTLDQIAALRWVRDNIAAFGGDPSNVTIFGESAGGESVAHMMISPLARGLFQRAIMQSAGTGETLIHLKRPVLGYMSAEDAGRDFAEKIVGSDGDPIKALRAMSSDELLAALKQHSELETYCYPVVDGYVLPKSVVETFRDGEAAPLPLLVGSNANEGTLLFSLGENPLGGSNPDGPTTLESYTRYIREAFGDDAEAMLKLYPAASDEDVKQATSALFCDYEFGVKARYYAKQTAPLDQPAYLYFFTRVPPSPRQTAGAFHAVDVGFVFEKMVPLFPTNDHDKTISKTMADFWAQFARAGNPNKEGLPQWPAYSESDPSNMVFGPKIGATAVERAASYDILERHLLQEVEQLSPEQDR